MARRKSIFVGFAAVISVALGVSSSQARIPKRIETQIKADVVPAFRRDDWRDIEKVLSTWVSKFDGEELDEIDALLDTHGAPNVGRLLLDTRMSSLMAGFQQKKTQARELTRSMPELSGQIDEIVRNVKALPFFGDKLPEFNEMQKYKDTFWDIHVARNELRSAAKLASYGARMTKEVSDRKTRGLSETEKHDLEIDFSKHGLTVRQTLDELDEIKTEMQIVALGKAAKIVRESQDYKERLRAGYVLAFSADPVIESLRSAKPADYDRPVLKDPQLLASVESNVRYARESSGDIIEQARLLFLGMHWWMRGRYGQGPDGMGLLKSVESLRSKAAQFPLFMPTKPPRPTESSESAYGYSVPKFDRRHHYIWMYEYRTIQKHVHRENQSSTSRSRKLTSATKLDRFY